MGDSDVEVLREIIRQLQRENEELHRRLAEQTEKLAQLEGKDVLSELKAELDKLKEQIASQKKKRFGRSSERRRRKKPKDKAGDKEKEKQKGHGHRSQPDLPEDTQEHTVPAEERGECVCCGGQLEATEQTVDGSELITMVERLFKLVRHRRRVYRCRCKTESLVAKGPVKLMPTGRYSLELAIGVAVDKYWLSQPLARQVREMGLHGLVIDTQTLWDQLDVLAKHLEPSYELVQQYILSADMIGAPVASSSWLMCRLTVPRDMPSASAALVNEPRRTTSTNAVTWMNNSGRLIGPGRVYRQRAIGGIYCCGMSLVGSPIRALGSPRGPIARALTQRRRTHESNRLHEIRTARSSGAERCPYTGARRGRGARAGQGGGDQRLRLEPGAR